MAYADLLRSNPWWENPENINNDREMLRFAGEGIKYYPDLPLEEGVHVIRGPRQVGKTTMLKLRIRELLGKKTDPRNIFFYSFELKRTPEEVHDIVLEYIETVAQEGKRHIFLDETTTIPDWSRALKLLIDRGDIRARDSVAVTGSSSIDLAKGSERLPGRGIEGNEFYYLPCSFREYLRLRGIELKAGRISDHESFLRAARGNSAKVLVLNRELSSYLSRGGFLYSMNHGADELALEKYARWLEGDFIKWGKNPLVVREMLQAVVRKKCSQFSYNSIVSETSVTSHNTVIEYIGMLGEELFMKHANKASLSPFRVERRKEKKAFFTDPLLAAVAGRWAGMAVEESCMVEHAVQSHLSRMGSVYFYNDGKKEIDALLRIGDRTLGAEVKWSRNVSEEDTYGVRKADIPYLLCRESFGMIGKVAVVPVSVFLAMLDVGSIVRRDVLAPG